MVSILESVSVRMMTRINMIDSLPNTNAHDGPQSQTMAVSEKVRITDNDAPACSKQQNRACGGPGNAHET